ncbi:MULTISPECIES: DUF2970 domain-containing protein [unclassified Variovorax]|uniref:DUF2970 domain-containing protein n=1 Tax=unclassified Variovorax TaxID=663243 RepID=UPI001315CD1C|nr:MULTISPECIES: DUF2970 domain-containing protein [unclassified Variovorax]VTU24700.1 hypothetical protein SRS16CHR_03506 [Variovorax sp. SRS16]VTU32870.1 hypothetical protein E5CHR_03503 [Variovorax sp. PBL-E5]
MSKFLRYLRAVLWAFIGLGGRRSDAAGRVDQAGVLPTIAIALVLVLLIVCGLIALAKFAAGA